MPLITMLNYGAFTYLAVLFLSVKSAPSVEEYMNLRQKTFQIEQSMMLGGNQSLSDTRETLVNKILMKFKSQEYKEGIDSDGIFFAGAKHFFHSKDIIDRSNVFKIISLLPKGAALHMHDLTVGSMDFVVSNLSKWNNLYYCVGENDHLQFHFYPSQPSAGCSDTARWETVQKLRDEASSSTWVDNWFFKSMSMVTETPEIEYPDTNVAWKLFETKIATLNGMANYEPALREYYYNVLKDHYEDNIMYLEIRGLLTSVYHLNQTELSTLEILKVYKETTDRFMQDYPDFVGAKFIYSPRRFLSPSHVGGLINNAVVMKQTYPNYFAGFDLVGQEDIGPPLLTFLPQLLDATDKGLKFFFHSGETDWRGTKIDENLFDAVLLNTTRIGHGFALSSHPLLLEIARKRGIGVEVCPISNQVLRLVKDLRNHPASNYLREGFPMVIAADGPGIYGSKPLSHDWYMAFMAIAGQHADLRFLKQLALNSIECSAMSSQEKTSARTQWETWWSIFLDKVLEQYNFLAEAPEDNSH